MPVVVCGWRQLVVARTRPLSTILVAANITTRNTDTDRTFAPLPNIAPDPTPPCPAAPRAPRRRTPPVPAPDCGPAPPESFAAPPEIFVCALAIVPRQHTRSVALRPHTHASAAPPCAHVLRGRAVLPCRLNGGTREGLGACRWLLPRQATPVTLRSALARPPARLLSLLRQPCPRAPVPPRSSQHKTLHNHESDYLHSPT
ncbi:hypothetical protein DFH27DRAFT_261013 [Peziza echinospora]|nr:hypothetical protein DFH27DRAFT_261013 [Peziza echinospora]